MPKPTRPTRRNISKNCPQNQVNNSCKVSGRIIAYHNTKVKFMQDRQKKIRNEATSKAKSQVKS